MTPAQPKVSVIVSTYNWPEALELTIGSIGAQTRLPDEIVIADDGSTDATRSLIARLQAASAVPIRHIWHDDLGFRRTVIMNKAMAAATGDYLIQVDGDVVLSPHFVADHMELAERGYFVCGSRVRLSEPMTRRMMERRQTTVSIVRLPPGYILNSLRSRVLRHFMALRYAKAIDHLRGCNMAFWKSDIVAVNGYDENLLEWGHEDGELAWRLHFAGVRKKALKMGGNVYHLHHTEASRSNEHTHLRQLQATISERRTWCPNGIDKHLKNV